ncbi:ABC transporter substrate-binding protein [Marinobacter halodurans]|uniref:ABC transporter substrate-binding protein n=1 Tax=Marinobacter halodurans TaxID=2528979 RepID=A0ABY1ZNC0_9GAMM|nr:ABC transporter substrate-binding protein [Marinobacter halodurans]TBW56005.1 ABC transporter substrate-binding protein [Marinobacter halodurans]
MFFRRSLTIVRRIRQSARRALCPLLALLWLSPVWAQGTLHAADDGRSHVVFLAGSENISFNLVFRKRLEEALPEGIRIARYATDAAKKSPDSLILTLGASRLNDVVQQNPDSPVLALMVTEDQFSQYQELDNPSVTAVYLNPPLKRQALLGRQILPQATRVALLARAGKEQQYSELADSLAEYGLELRVFTVEDRQSLVSTLSRALNYGDFLLGTPDPEIYNRQTIKHILLTAYRHNRILIGPERAFVQAGALASTYTSTNTIVSDAAKTISDYVRSGQLPRPHYPTRFSVLFNEQVARSLNIPLPDRESVLQALQRLESSSTGVGNE